MQKLWCIEETLKKTCANMFEPKNKQKSKNKKPKSKTTKNNILANGETRQQKKNVARKIHPGDGIAKSKQLAQKLQTSKSSSYGQPKNRSSNKDDELRLCGNGKPMPSLYELEKMFEDSDDDEENKDKNTPKNATAPSTPKSNPKPKPVQKLMSPTTISEIANKVLDLVSNISHPSELLEDGPPAPIIKPKKRRKPDQPYIVGCKERPYVPENPTNRFCKGDDKYGPDSEDGEDDDLPAKRAKRGKKVNISKSIFNAKSDEIAARLKECDGDSDGSDKTVAYELYTPLNSGMPRTFSPIPSTSKDNDIFVKNDLRFNESLISENMSKTNLENDIELLETPCETIEINDAIPYTATPKLDGPVIEIADDDTTQIFNDKVIASSKIDSIMDADNWLEDVKPQLNKDLSIDIDNNCVQVVDAKLASPIEVEDYYSNLDIENINKFNDDICEIIDVDDIIAENKAIIEKYSKTKNLDTVTLVDTSEINTTAQSDHSVNRKDSKLEETIKVTEPAESNIVEINSSRNSLTNEQPSVIFMNEVTPLHRPCIVQNVKDVEIIDDSICHPNMTANGPQNCRAVESVLIDLESSLQIYRNQELGNNRMRSNQPVATGHGCNCITESRDQQNQPMSHFANNNPPLAQAMRGHNANSEIQQSASSTTNNIDNSAPYNDSYHQQLKILKKFFRRRQKNVGEIRNKRGKKKNPRLSENILSQQFTSWLQSMANSMPNGQLDITAGNNKTPTNNQTLSSSPALPTNTDSPDRSGKRIGDCPICMDSLSNKPIVSTICGHIFCMECIKLSIRSNGNKCPTCRKALKKGTGYHQIFL